MPTNDIPHKPAFSVHVDDDITNHPPPTPQHVSQFDKVLSSRKPDKPSVMDALRNKVNLLFITLAESRVGTVVRVPASHQCRPSLIPTWCHVG